jgi:hypothetical protein
LGVRARRFATLVAAVLALAFLSTSTSVAASRTTAPGKRVLVYFVINDQKIAYAIYRETAGGGTSELFLERYVLRGDVATFIVINRGKKPHGFDFFGHKIPPIKPGKRAHFSAPLLRRGSFPYASPSDRGKAFKGVFPVY